MSKFENKVVLITGAGLGLGRELAKAFAAQGAQVALNDLMPNNIESLEEEIKAAGGTASTYAFDIAKKLPAQALVNLVEDDYGRIDILVNHASVQPHHYLIDMDEWDWRRTLDVILTGTFLMCQSIGRVMRVNGSGVILNIGPSAGDNPRGAYLAAKAGVLAFTEAATPEFAEHGIRVNAISPDKDTMAVTIEKALSLCA